MDDDREQLIYIAGGPLAALALGAALIPFRGFTTASNFTFLFLILTIVAAEYGGRWAALATALSSALSLDFFLTQPYLRLAIEDKHDIIAFIGLTACGLVAAALGSRRGERSAELRRARRHQALVHAALVELERAAVTEVRCTRTLDACRDALPLTAVVLRDGANGVVAAQPGARAAPEQTLEPDTLLPTGTPAEGPEQRRLPLPGEGGRLKLTMGGSHVGWLDVWGGREVASVEARLALSDVARVTAAMLALRKADPTRSR